MSLLETKNKKFNLPFIFIAGVIFIIGLSYFAHYLENFESNAIDLEQPKNTENTVESTSISVQLGKNEKVYIDSLLIPKEDLEKEIKIKLDGQANPTILLQVDENVPIEKMAHIMEFASENHYKIILEARSQ